MKAAWTPAFIPLLHSIDMSFYPDNSTAVPPVPPDAPRAAPATNFVPWEIAYLSGIGNTFEDDDDGIDLEESAIAEIEFIRAPYAPASPSQWTIAPTQRHTTAYEITLQEAPVRPSQEEMFSPIHLHRAVSQGEPMAQPATAQPGLRDIAGSPLNSPPGGFYQQSMAAHHLASPGDLLSSSSGNHPVLNHVTPEFDSTHQIMRIPPPQPTLTTTALPGEPGSGSASVTPQAPRMPALGELQPDSEMPLPRSSLSWALENAWVARPPQLTTTTTTTIPQSAPPVLERLPAVPPPVQRARAQDDHEYWQALVSERAQIVLLEAGLGELRHSAALAPETTQPGRYVFDALGAYRRSQPFNASDPVSSDSSDSSSDDEEVQVVGSPDPFAM